MPRSSHAPVTEALMALALVLVPRHAIAGAPPLDLAWQAPDGCPGARGVKAAVERLVQEGTHEPLRAEVTILRDGQRFRARLSMNGGERELVGHDCRAVTEAIVVVLALALDPSAAGRGSEEVSAALDQEEPAPPTPTAPSSALKREPEVQAPQLRRAQGERAQRPHPRVPPSFHAGALGGIDAGTLPEPTAGLGALVRLELRRATFELEGTWLVPRERTIPGTRSGARMSFGAAGASVCGALPRRTWRGELCAAGEAGILRGAPFAISHPAPATRGWVAVGPEAGVRVPASARLSWVARGIVLFPAIRNEYGIDGVGVVHTPPRAVGRAEVGLALRL